jgi:AraC-like DNA-binding protein
MPFELKNNHDNTVLLSNQLTAGDFEAGKPQSDMMEGPFKVTFPSGELNGSHWAFNGIRMVYSEYEFTSPAVLDWKGNLEMITMYFNLKGKFSLMGNGMSRAIELGNNQHNLFFGQEAEGSMKVDEHRMRSFMIQFTKDTFLQIANDGNDSIKRFSDRMSCGKSISFSDQNLDMDWAIQSCINAVLKCRYTDSLKKMFFFSKAIELLVLQAESYNKILSPHTQYAKSDYDRERIIFARDYLLKHIEAPPTLTELSRIAGINEFKLKRGFKEIFNQTVFGYLGDVRMDLARNDLHEGHKSITEIAFELGYSSVQHFSAAFKKKYGIPPGSVK